MRLLPLRLERNNRTMKPNVLNTNLSGKVAVVTGAGGVLCSDMAKTLARAGAKVALLNRTLSKAQVHADAIVAEGGIAKAYQCNVLVENDCKVVAQQVLEDFGPCDILVNGAGGNSAKANTDKEFYEPGDIDVIVPHQANFRIIETAAKNLKLPMDKFFLNLSEYGNTSSASIPIAFCEAIEKGKVKSGDKVCFVGFGAGLTYAGVIFEY